jgi:predicted nucleotidyltransferase
MEKLLNELVSRLRAAYEDELVSVVLYGSAASGEFHQNFSDLNVLAVLKQVGVPELERGREAVAWWRRQKQPLPLLLSREEIENANDVFPIEFLDIQHNHRVLYGEDVAAGITIDTRQHRSQVEHELRAAALRLRGRFLGLQQDASDVARLMLDSVSSFATLFRHALIVAGGAAPVKKREIFRAARERFAISGEPFEKLLAAREQNRKLGAAEIRPLFESYLAEIARVTESVDKL